MPDPSPALPEPRERRRRRDRRRAIARGDARHSPAHAPPRVPQAPRPRPNGPRLPATGYRDGGPRRPCVPGPSEAHPAGAARSRRLRREKRTRRGLRRRCGGEPRRLLWRGEGNDPRRVAGSAAGTSRRRRCATLFRSRALPDRSSGPARRHRFGRGSCSRGRRHGVDTDRRRARAGRGAAGRPRSDGGARSAHRAGAPRRSRRPSTRRGRFHSPKPEPHRRRSARSARRPARSSRVRPSEARNPSRDRASLCGGTPRSCPSPGCPAGRSDTGSRREIERPPVGRGDPEPRRARGSLSAFPSRFLSRSTGEQAVCPDPRKGRNDRIRLPTRHLRNGAAHEEVRASFDSRRPFSRRRARSDRLHPESEAGQPCGLHPPRESLATHRPPVQHHYTEIYIAPWNTEYLRKMTWWEKIERGEKIKEDARELAAFARLTFQEAFRNDRKHRFKVVEEPGPNTLIAEFALTEVVPNRIVLNALGYAAGPVAGPAGSAAANLETATTKSTVAFEGRMKDGETKEVVALFADRESQKYSPVNVKDLTWYGHARSIIREWADQFVRMASKAPTEIIKDSPPFDLRPW
ncbi:MAG: hypothetical protein DMF54_14330 [Acidobacteria bacterium]|nr:MAG: hypothetical protein DMF54_14330 [Acidobacteriota bacterium]